MILVRSSGERSTSPDYTSTPSFIAKSFTYFCLRIFPILDNVSWTFANAVKFGMAVVSSFYLAIFKSVAAIPSSIAFCAASIFALASSTVSKWPSSSSYLTGSSEIAGSAAILAASNWIFYSTAASPATNIY